MKEGVDGPWVDEGRDTIYKVHQMQPWILELEEVLALPSEAPRVSMGQRTVAGSVRFLTCHLGRRRHGGREEG